MIEKQLEELISSISKKMNKLQDLGFLQYEDKRSNRVSRARKELDSLLRLAQEWDKKLYNIDRYIKENLTACLMSPDEDIRKRAQQLQRSKQKKKGKKKGKK